MIIIRTTSSRFENLTKVPMHLCVDFLTFGCKGSTRIKAYFWVTEVLDEEWNQRVDLVLHVRGKLHQVWHQVIQDLVDFHKDFYRGLVALQAGPKTPEQVVHCHSIQIHRRQVLNRHNRGKCVETLLLKLGRVEH